MVRFNCAWNHRSEFFFENAASKAVTGNSRRYPANAGLKAGSHQTWAWAERSGTEIGIGKTHWCVYAPLRSAPLRSWFSRSRCEPGRAGQRKSAPLLSARWSRANGKRWIQFIFLSGAWTESDRNHILWGFKVIKRKQNELKSVNKTEIR